MKSFAEYRELEEAKATPCGRCGTTHVPPSQGGTCPALAKEETELDEAVKIGTKVKIHAPGESYHGEVGHVGEIRHGAYKGAPKTYTVDYGDRKSIQLDKKEVKVHKEEAELDEGFKKGDFIKTPTGEVHRVFDVKGNSLETAPYRGKNGYGGGTTVHKTKATKVPTPKDVNEEVDQIDELNQMTLSRYAGKARSVINTNLAMAGDKSTSAGKSKEMYDKIRKRAAGVKTANRKMASGEYSEEVDQLEEMTQGKEYTQAQLQKKIQSGNWEATHDIKPGKHVEMRHHSGKRVMVQVKEEVDSTVEDLTEGTQSSIEKKIQAKQDSLSLAKEQRRAKGQHVQGQREIKLQAEIDRLNTELTQLKRQGMSEESELGDLAHQKTLKHRFLVTYSDPNHTSASMRKEKQQKHVLVPGTQNGQSVYKGDAEPLVKKYMNKQGYRVHEIEHVGMVSKKVNEHVDQLDEADRPSMSVGGVRRREDDEGYGKQKVTGKTSTSHFVHINGRHWKTFDTAADANRAKDAVKKKYPDKRVHVQTKTFYEEAEHVESTALKPFAAFAGEAN